jgi:hypothetical protein
MKRSTVYSTKFGHANTARIMEVIQVTLLSTDKGIHQIINKQAITVHCQVIQTGGKEHYTVQRVMRLYRQLIHTLRRYSFTGKAYTPWILQTLYICCGCHLWKYESG